MLAKGIDVVLLITLLYQRLAKLYILEFMLNIIYITLPNTDPDYGKTGSTIS